MERKLLLLCECVGSDNMHKLRIINESAGGAKKQNKTLNCVKCWQGKKTVGGGEDNNFNCNWKIVNAIFIYDINTIGHISWGGLQN